MRGGSGILARNNFVGRAKHRAGWPALPPLAQIRYWKIIKTVRQLIVIIFFKSLLLTFFFIVRILHSVHFSFIIYFVFFAIIIFFHFFLTPQTIQIQDLRMFHQQN